MKIQVLGTGCPKCEKLTKLVKEVVANFGVEAEVEKVSELSEIMAFGVSSTPALVIDGEVKASGRLPSETELQNWIAPDSAKKSCDCGGACGGEKSSNGFKKVLLVVVLIAAVFGVVLTKNKEKSATENATTEIAAVDGHSKLQSSMEAVAKSGLPKLLDLGASKCIPCKQMEPILNELAVEFDGKMDVVFIDVWKNESAGNDYKIRMIPTQIFIDANGKELFRHEGFYSKNDILAKWKELGVSL